MLVKIIIKYLQKSYKKVNNFMLYASFLLLSGCFSSDQDVHEFVEQIKKSSAGKVNELPPAREVNKQEFGAGELRSPFAVAKRTDKIGSLGLGEGRDATPEIVQAPRPDADRQREFLERNPLTDYVMVGSISKGNYIWGLVQDTSGLVYPIQVGDYIGENSGKVTAITDYSIMISQTIEDGKGGWMPERTTLQLKEADDEKGSQGSQKTRRPPANAPKTADVDEGRSFQPEAKGNVETAPQDNMPASSTPLPENMLPGTPPPPVPANEPGMINPQTGVPTVAPVNPQEGQANVRRI